MRREPGSSRTTAGRSAPSGGACCGGWSAALRRWCSSASSCSRPPRSGSSIASSRAGFTSARTAPSAERRPRKSLLFGIREDVVLQPGAHALLLAGPERRIEQVAVVLVEDLARARIAHQEAIELLGKHVALAHAPVGLG